MPRDRRADRVHGEYRLLAAASVDGRLDPDSAAALEAHLATCEACRADRAAMLADYAMLAEPAAAVMPMPRVRAFVLDAARAPRIPRTVGSPATRTPVYAVVALVALIAVVGLGVSGPNGFFGVRPATSSESAVPVASGSPVNASQPESLPPGTPSPAQATQSASATPPTLSTSPVPRIGERIEVWPSPPATFPADAAFNLGQGFCYDQTDENPLEMVFDPGTHVDFFIDGVFQAPAREVFAPFNQCVVGAAWIVNVPAGLPAGTHRFDVQWYNVGILDQSKSAAVVFE